MAQKKIRAADIKATGTPDATTALFGDNSWKVPATAASSYIHEQNIPSNTWTVAHNLGFFPNVRVINSAGDSGMAQIEDVDNNNLILHLDGSMAGKAYCS